MFARLYWPHVHFYDKQIEIIESVRDNQETIVPAAHQVGKDFVAGFIALWFFLTSHPVRVVATSIRDDHLRVLFGEIGRYIETSALPIDSRRGGPLLVRHREIKKIVNGTVCPISYLVGMVSEKGEGMQGHHAEHTLLIVDEASGVEDVVFERADSWAKRKLVFGNPYGGGSWFYKAVKGGDIS